MPSIAALLSWELSELSPIPLGKKSLLSSEKMLQLIIGQFSPFLCQLWIEANMWSLLQSPTRICFFSPLFFCLIGSNTNKKEQGFGKWPKFGINVVVVMKCMKLLLPYEIPNGDNNITILHRSNFNASSALISIFTKQASLDWIFPHRDGLAECEKPRFHIFHGL